MEINILISSCRAGENQYETMNFPKISRILKVQLSTLLGKHKFPYQRRSQTVISSCKVSVYRLSTHFRLEKRENRVKVHVLNLMGGELLGSQKRKKKLQLVSYGGRHRIKRFEGNNKLIGISKSRENQCIQCFAKKFTPVRIFLMSSNYPE